MRQDRSGAAPLAPEKVRETRELLRFYTAIRSRLSDRGDSSMSGACGSQSGDGL
jgi:hypothetical protein